MRRLRVQRCAETTLPPDLLERTPERLAHASLLVALAVGGAFAIMHVSPTPTAGSLQVAHLAALTTVSLALVTFVVARRARRPQRVVDGALVFEVAIAYGIATAETFATYQPDAAVRGVSWLCLWIVLFPLVVPATPGKTLLAAVACALASPIALALVVATGAPRPSVVTAIYLVMPSLFAAALAVVCSRILHRLREAASAADELGSYRLVERLGAGGMGEVWRAEHRTLARPAAIKLVRPDVLTGTGSGGGDPETVRRRFEREAQVTAGLTSPHTIQVYDYGITDDGTAYYVMELLDGLDLETLVNREGPLDPFRVLDYLLQACDSLGEAHGHGLVHRDIKPANLYVCRQGGRENRLKVLDFGLVAHRAALDGQATRLTATGSIGGTPAYIAPEIVHGARPVDHRADFYSLGCVAYWMLTGRTIFEGTPVQVMYGHLEKEPSPPSVHTPNPIPRCLERIVLDCLSKDPLQRPKDAAELAARLTECVESFDEFDDASFDLGQRDSGLDEWNVLDHPVLDAVDPLGETLGEHWSMLTAGQSDDVRRRSEVRLRDLEG